MKNYHGRPNKLFRFIRRAAIRRSKLKPVPFLSFLCFAYNIILTKKINKFVRKSTTTTLKLVNFNYCNTQLIQLRKIKQ